MYTFSESAEEMHAQAAEYEEQEHMARPPYGGEDDGPTVDDMGEPEYEEEEGELPYYEGGEDRHLDAFMEGHMGCE